MIISYSMTDRAAALRAKLSEVEGKLAQALEANAALEKENTLLRQKIDLLVRRIFGASSEKLDAAQLELLLGLEDAAGKAAASPELGEAALLSCKDPSRPAHPRGREPRWPADLPVIEQVIEPAEVKAAPQAWRGIGEEVSEQLEYEPARFVRLRLIRRKFVQRGKLDAVPVIAPLPEKLQERGLAAPGLPFGGLRALSLSKRLAQIIVGKYCDHLPLYRQEQIYWTRHRVHLPRQTMANWMGLAADWLKPIYETIRTGVMGGGYVQVDETPIAYLCPGHGKTKQGYLWACHRPGGDAIYHWQTSRAAACLEKIVPVDFQGVLQSDGYAAYGAFARERGGSLTLAGCWAHAARPPASLPIPLRRLGGAAFTRHSRAPRATRCSSCARSATFIPSSGDCARAAPGRACGPSHARSKADPSSHDSGRPCAVGKRGTAICRRARWVKPSTTPWASGPRSAPISTTVAWRSTTTSWKTRSAPRRSARRTGSSSATPPPANAEPFSTASWKAAAAGSPAHRPP